MTEQFEIFPQKVAKDGTLIIIQKGLKLYNISDVVDLLNTLHRENTCLKLELDTHKHPLWSTREAERKVSELTDLLSNETIKNAILLKEINSLRKENMRLKDVQKYE